MPFEFDANGNIATQEVNGQKLPIFVHADGKKAPFDADSTLGTITRLNGEAKTHREGKEAAEGRLKLYDGIDAEAARKALELTKNLDDKKLVDAGKVEEVRAAAVRAYEEREQATAKAHANALQERDASIAKLTAQLHAEVIGGSFARSKFIAEKVAMPADFVQAVFGKNFKVEDGKLAAYNNDGSRVFSMVRPGDPNVDFEEAIAILVDSHPQKASILKGTGASGGGATGGGSGSGGQKSVTRARWDGMSPSERMAHAKSGGVVTD